MIGCEVILLIERYPNSAHCKNPVLADILPYVFTELINIFDVELTSMVMTSADCSNISVRRLRHEVPGVTNTYDGPFTSLYPVYWWSV